MRKETLPLAALVVVTLGLTGPDFLVTNLDGTRELHLTCQAPDPSLVDRYRWSTPGDATKRCNTTLAPNVCTFEPMLEDDNRNVTCIALNSTGSILVRGVYTVNLKYPPPHPPSLSPTEQLKQGDVITCTVSGGKPRVTNVTFHCQHPGHADREDDVSDDGRTVSSSIMVTVSETRDVNVTCTCSAYWAPEPGLYSHVLNRTVTLKSPKTTTTSTTTTEAPGVDDNSTEPGGDPDDNITETGGEPGDNSTQPVGEPDDNTRPGETESTSSNALAIGLGVAGAAFVVMALVGFCCCFRKRRSEGQHNAPPAKATPAKATPAKAVPAKATPAKGTPAKATLANVSPPHALRVSGGAVPSTEKTAHDSLDSEVDDSSVAESETSEGTEDSDWTSETSEV